MISILKLSFRTLDHLHKKYFKIMILLTLIGTIMEMLSIALILPLLSFVVDNKFIEQYPYFNNIYISLGSPDQKNLILILFCFLILVYFIKALYLSFLQWFQFKFVFSVEKNLGERLFKKYLSENYLYHVNNNSAILMRNILSEVSVCSAAMTGLVGVITEIFVLAGILIVLFIYEPILCLSLIFLSLVITSMYYIFTKEKLKYWGLIRQNYEGYKLKHLQQGLGAIKDIKIFGKENFFFSLFQLTNAKVISVALIQRFIVALPRLWLDIIALLCLLIVINVMFYENRPLELLIPTLGLFLGAAFRILPSFNRIMNALQGFKFAFPGVEKVHSELQQSNKNSHIFHKSQKPTSFKNEIILKDVSFSYESSSSQIFDKVNLKIPFGSTIGIIGQSGVGKSTLVDLILGLLSPTNGQILVDGLDIKNNLQSWQSNIGYVPQEIYLTDNSLIENVAFGVEEKFISKENVKNAIKLVNLNSFVHELKEGYDTNVGEKGARLSGGQKQRIGIARALYINPTLLVLDEATSALDLDNEEAIIDDIYQLEKKLTTIIISHRETTLRKCDYIFKLSNHGEIKEVNLKS